MTLDSNISMGATPEPKLETRRFLLLQGLMGPFFERVGRGLLKEGYGVHKIHFNGGDRLFWRLPNATDYCRSLEEWPAYLRDFIARNGITDVLLFGDCRPHHAAALELCRELHVPVHVFEEGYLRPDWVTLELGGVNGHSKLPQDPEYYLKEAAHLPEPEPHHPVPSSFRRRAMEGIAYNTADILSRWHYPHWTNHRPWHPLTEGVGWLRRLSDRKAAIQRSEEVLRRLSASKAPYMLFPLQLNADAQVRLHSGFSGIEDAIEKVIASFATSAPLETRLIIKEHPLDNGIYDWRRIVGRIARKYDVIQRVGYVERGDIAVMVRGAKGVVTINSTTGTLAVAENIPVITLGQAVYNIPGITHQDGLDKFWVSPQGPDPEIFMAFRRVLIEYCLVPGGFFSEEGLETLVNGVISRLQRHCLIKFREACRTNGPDVAAWDCMRRPILSLSAKLADIVEGF